MVHCLKILHYKGVDKAGNTQRPAGRNACGSDLLLFLLKGDIEIAGEGVPFGG